MKGNKRAFRVPELEQIVLPAGYALRRRPSAEWKGILLDLFLGLAPGATFSRRLKPALSIVPMGLRVEPATQDGARGARFPSTSLRAGRPGLVSTVPTGLGRISFPTRHWAEAASLRLRSGQAVPGYFQLSLRDRMLSWPASAGRRDLGMRIRRAGDSG